MNIDMTHAAAVRPEQNELDDDEGAGVDEIFAAEHRLHERQHEYARVGVDDGQLLGRVEAQRASENGREQQEERVREERGGEREDEAADDLPRVLYLERAYDYARRDEVDYYRGYDAAVLRFEHARPDERPAHRHYDEELRYLFREYQAYLHYFSPPARISAPRYIISPLCGTADMRALPRAEIFITLSAELQRIL